MPYDSPRNQGSARRVGEDNLPQLESLFRNSSAGLPLIVLLPPPLATARQPTPSKSRVSSGYRSNDEKKVKDRVRAATIESKPDSSSGEDAEPEEVQMAVNLDDVHIQA